MKLPPFAKQLQTRPHIPKNEIYIYAGSDGWWRAKEIIRGFAVLVYPDDGTPPREYDWRIVRGRTVTVMHPRESNVPEPVLDELAEECVRAGAAEAFVISPGAFDFCRVFRLEVTLERCLEEDMAHA